MKAVLDKYYGANATQYDAKRKHTARWKAENEAVQAFVTDGPVLDVPLGTGRYIPTYRAKGLDFIGLDVSGDMIAVARKNYGEIDARKGSILDLPFQNNEFATVVSTRILDWLSPKEMARAVAELRRVAQTLIVTVRHGEAGCPSNYTHDIGYFLDQMQGLMIVDRRHTETTKYGTEEIFKLRPPTWADVTAQFAHLNPSAEHHINRLANEWVGHGLLPREVEIRPDNTEVRAEYWPIADLWTVIKRMSALYDHKATRAGNGYITDDKPRKGDRPVTIFETRHAHVLLDGRRRVNQWRGKGAGRYPVLVLRQL